MKKKIFCGFATTVAAIMLLSGCGAGRISDVKPAEKFSDCFAEKPGISVNPLDLDGYSVKDYKNGTMLFEKNNGFKTDYAVYFSHSGKTMEFAASDSEEWSDIALFGCENHSGFKCAALRIKRMAGDNAEYCFYDGRGELFASSEKEDCSDVGDGYFEVSGEWYIIKNDGRFEKTEINEKSSSAVVYSENYVAVKGEEFAYFSNSGVYVYERKSGKTVYSFRYEPETYDLSVFFTADEKLIIQEIVKEAVATSKYTYIDGNGEKFTVKTRIVTLDGEIKEERLKYPFVILSLKNADNDCRFTNVYDCENVATVYPIEDYRIARNAHAKVVIDNDGKTKVRIDNVEEGFVSAEFIGNDRWLVKTSFGEVKVMTDDKKTLSVWSDKNMLSRFAGIDGKLYDLKLDGVIDLKNEGYNTVGLNEFNAVLEDSEGNRYLYDGTMTKIEEDSGMWKHGYYIEKDGKRTYYSDKALFESYGEIGVFSITERDAVIEYKTAAAEKGFIFIGNYYL